MLRGVEFDIGASELCHLLSVPSTAYGSSSQRLDLKFDGFDPATAIRRLTGSTTYGVSQLQASYLTHKAHLLHQIVGCCILPRGGHWNEVSYLEAFILDSILVGGLVDLGHLMIRHMISSQVLPYGSLFTCLFTIHGLDLFDQTDR